jgi:Holliday junction DNA helicase RuvA
MIARVRGTLLEKGEGSCLVEAGGLGYEVLVSARTAAQLPALGQELALLTSFQVREDSQHLYGFLAAAEKEAFLLLQTVKGVGPRLALAVLSGLTPAELRGAVQKHQVATLVALPGVGKKIAERVVLELSDKVAGLALGEVPPMLGRGLHDPAQQAEEALRSLGYAPALAQRAARQALDQLGADAGLEAIIKLALKSL